MFLRFTFFNILSLFSSDPSSSHEFNNNMNLNKNVATTTKVDPTLTKMVKKFMEKKPNTKTTTTKLFIPSDFIAQDLKKDAKRVTGFSSLQKKLFGKNGVSEKKEKVKALTEVKGNTRTLAMVLRSERELLSINKEQKDEIFKLKNIIENKNKEVEKLKDLCLNQREEIKLLKSSILFPDATNSQLQELVEKQGSELKEAKQFIPLLQQQVKAEKFSTKTGLQGYGSSGRTPPEHGREDTLNSWDFSSEDNSDDLVLKDFNPCLTPYNAKTRSRNLCRMKAYLKTIVDKVYPEVDDFNLYNQ